MPVGEMLERMSAAEVSEWAAYERATGPLGGAYERDTLATLVETMSSSEDGRYHHPRPHEIHELVEKHLEADEKAKEVSIEARMAAFDKEAGFA